jgi:hypothetical protein
VRIQSRDARTIDDLEPIPDPSYVPNTAIGSISPDRRLTSVPEGSLMNQGDYKGALTKPERLLYDRIQAFLVFPKLERRPRVLVGTDLSKPRVALDPAGGCRLGGHSRFRVGRLPSSRPGQRAFAAVVGARSALGFECSAGHGRTAHSEEHSLPERGSPRRRFLGRSRRVRVARRRLDRANGRFTAAGLACAARASAASGLAPRSASTTAPPRVIRGTAGPILSGWSAVSANRVIVCED